jgi:hypothetical protein
MPIAVMIVLIHISVVAVEKVLRRAILKLTWALPKKDNRAIPSASLKRLAEWMVELPNFGSSDRLVEPQAWSNANTSFRRLGMPRAAASGVFNSSMRGNMDSPTVPQDTPTELADDILRGADQIAEFIFGERGSRRKVYYLAECSRLPVFRLGSVLCARKSVLLRWISGQESRVLDSAG